jgi:hypothetical protein
MQSWAALDAHNCFPVDPPLFELDHGRHVEPQGEASARVSGLLNAWALLRLKLR